MAQTYVERFAQVVTEIIANVKARKTNEYLRYAYNGVGYDIADRTQRMTLIARVTDDYVLAHADVNQAILDSWSVLGEKGERPSPITLDTSLIDRLTDAVLDEELTDPDPYKIAHEEYPFMSDYQLELRRDRETGLKAVEETGTDGRDYRKPAKRRRTNYENWRVDSAARVRNADRAAQYKRDIAAGQVSTRVSDSFVTGKRASLRWLEMISQT